MISEPGKYLKDFADAGTDILTVHVEVEEDVSTLLDRIRKANMKAGATLRPGTEIEALFPLLPKLDLALIMSVEPGFGGQSFMPESIDRVRALKAEIARRGLDVEIEIDGGIGVENARPGSRSRRTSARRGFGRIPRRGHCKKRTGHSPGGNGIGISRQLISCIKSANLLYSSVLPRHF